MDAHELTQKWHGLPMYVWIGGGGLLLGGVVIYIRKRAGTGATPAAAVADNTPSAADNGAVTDTGSMPWSGGAPTSDGSVDALSTVVGNLADQEGNDASSAAAAITASLQQQAQDELAWQNGLTSMAADNAKNAKTFSDQYAALVASTNDAVAKATAAAPAPSQANVPALQAQPGIGYHTSSYLPAKTVAAAAKKGVVHAQ